MKVCNLGKRYDLGGQSHHGRLYDKLGSLVRRDAPSRHAADTTFWALRNISFELPKGHVLGVIGRNGSGKSTLMRILARVTHPSEGLAETRGRIGSLLTVGTGFHPELSGRDNIALSGAILGMHPKEVAAVQDQIVAFAEIEQFLDTPVKHYSSGMYMRLAFSVSAHLPAEIMLIDEVLAVGDASFQDRCLQRIRDVVREGRTVLFVSHSSESLRALCHTGLVIDHGRTMYHGPIADAVTYYERDMLGMATVTGTSAMENSLPDSAPPSLPIAMA